MVIANEAAARMASDRTESFGDPYRLYSALQDYGPYRAEDAPGEPLWILARHDDVAASLLDERLISTPQGTARQIAERPAATAGARQLRGLLSQQIEVMNGPEHRRLRGIVAGAVAHLPARLLNEIVKKRAHELLDAVHGAAVFDFMARIAAPLPRLVLLDLLGLPADERQVFADAVQTLLGSLRHRTSGVADGSAGEDAAEAIVAMAAGWRKRAVCPGPPLLIERLLAAKGLSTEELAANVVLLFAAGHGTTTSLLGNAVWLWLDDATRPAGDILRFVEEVLRHESPIQSLRRVAAAAVEIGGRRIEARAELLLLLGAAHRDPGRYAVPQTFDPAQPRPSHLAFGLGAHKCPGARLARLQAEAVLAAIAAAPARLSRVAAEPDWMPSATTRSLRSLHLRWAGGGSDAGHRWAAAPEND